MQERRKRIMKRLLVEELERRAMLNGTEIAMAATGLTNNSYEDFYKAQVGTQIGGAAGVGMLDELMTNSQAVIAVVANVMNQGNPVAAYPEATTGVGQMTITTGANTPGIGSFATPTNGPSHAGGTGNANLGSPTGPTEPAPEATDQAIEELSLELPRLAAGKGAKDSQEPVETADHERDYDRPARHRELVASVEG